MSLIESLTGILTFDADGDLDDFVCTDRAHEAVGNVCTSCKALHLPSLEAKPYCTCETPDLLVCGLPAWRCGVCDLPNREALANPPKQASIYLPEGKRGGTIRATKS